MKAGLKVVCTAMITLLFLAQPCYAAKVNVLKEEEMDIIRGGEGCSEECGSKVHACPALCYGNNNNLEELPILYAVCGSSENPDATCPETAYRCSKLIMYDEGSYCGGNFTVVGWRGTTGCSGTLF